MALFVRTACQRLTAPKSSVKVTPSCFTSKRNISLSRPVFAENRAELLERYFKLLDTKATDDQVIQQILDDHAKKTGKKVTEEQLLEEYKKNTGRDLPSEEELDQYQAKLVNALNNNPELKKLGLGENLVSNTHKAYQALPSVLREEFLAEFRAARTHSAEGEQNFERETEERSLDKAYPEHVLRNIQGKDPVEQFYLQRLYSLLHSLGVKPHQWETYISHYDFSNGTSSLEWTVPSPPPPHTFEELPIIKEINEEEAEYTPDPAAWQKWKQEVGLGNIPI